MKKTLAAVAVLGAFAGSALAADVTLYGKVDLGLQYMHSEKGNVEADTWGLKSGSGSSSRFGLKGVEEISEGLKVGFQLEHGFSADKQEETKLFSREMRLYVATDFGTLHMGRFGALDSTTGSLAIGGDLSAMGGGYGSQIADQGHVFHKPSRFANSIAYTSPEFAGVTVSAMASLGEDAADKVEFDVAADGTVTIKGTKGEGAEGSADVDRYYALGAQGQWGALGAGLIVSTEDFGAEGAKHDHDNSKNVTAGVNYDFGVAKVYLAGNYYDDGLNKDQYGVVASADVPFSVGKAQFQAGYGKFKDDTVGAKNEDHEAFTVGAYYHYPLSKRTYLYTSAGYTKFSYDTEAVAATKDAKTTEVVAGLVHNF